MDSWPQAIPTLDTAIANHPDFLKITYEEEGWGTRPMITLLPIPLMQHIIEYYNDHGIRSTVHVSSEIRAREAIFVGVDTLAHPDIQGPVTDAFVRLMAAKQMPMASTLTIGENYSRLADHPEFLDQPLYQAVLEPEEIQRLKTTESEIQKKNRWASWMAIMTPVAQENITGKSMRPEGSWRWARINPSGRQCIANWNCWSAAEFRRWTPSASPL